MAAAQMESTVAQSLQSTFSLSIAKRRYFGTVWRVEGAHLLVTCRGDLRPGSHARLVWELEENDPRDSVTIEADVIVRRAGAMSDTGTGSQRHSLELRSLSDADRRTLDAWLASRNTRDDVDPDRPTDMVLGGSASLVEDLPTAYMARPSDRLRPDMPPLSDSGGGQSSETPGTLPHARARVERQDGRLRLSWRNWGDMHADWTGSLSKGQLFVRGLPANPGVSFAIIAHLPDGRMALFSGLVSRSVADAVALDVTMGDQTRALLSRQAPSSRRLPARH